MSRLRLLPDPDASPISPLQYGQFVEYLCDLVPGIWAEKLCDGGFEGLGAYEVAFRTETDFRERPWYATGAVNRGRYLRDPEEKVGGSKSMSIRMVGQSLCTLGISQDGIAVLSGHPLQLRCWLRSTRPDNLVEARLHEQNRTLASATFQAGLEWQSFAATLAPLATTAESTLSLQFRGPGAIWIDNISLMPAQTVGGWRTDVVEAIRALRPGVIRFGGSDVERWDWQDTVGDPDRRVPFYAWGGLQPTGPGLEEIVQLCHFVGAVPLICVRFTGRSPRDAADQVEYFNGLIETPMGRRRAENGHPEPYHIRLWQVGNEVDGPEYDRQLADFGRAMKSVDPDIRILSSYPSAEGIRSAAPYLDFVCPHQYDCGNLGATEQQLRQVRRLIEENAAGRPIKIGVTEWNTTAGDFGLPRAMLWTLENALACSRYHNLLHRWSGWVEIANRSNLVNSFCSGIIQTDNHRLYRTPTYFAQQLYAEHSGRYPMQVDGPPDLDISATWSPARRESQGTPVVTLFVVNSSLQTVFTTLDFSGLGSAPRGFEAWILADTRGAGEPDVTNSFDEPERVRPFHARAGFRESDGDYGFPPLSLTVLRVLLDGTPDWMKARSSIAPQARDRAEPESNSG